MTYLQQQQQQLEKQRQTWNQFSAGWLKWDDFLMKMFQPVTEGLINTLPLTGNEHILDIATGTGEPGLSIAQLLPEGQVTGTDLSERMAEISNQIAAQKGITNFHSHITSTANMPFADNTFDHIVSRFGIMFFPDLERSMKEVLRVLKPGGTFSAAVWAGPEKNIFISMVGKIVMEKLGLPKPPADAPGIFRYAQPGLASGIIANVGLQNVSEFTIQGETNFHSPQHFWDVSADVAGPIMQALNTAPTEVVEDVKQTILNQASQFMAKSVMKTDYEAIIITGTK